MFTTAELLTLAVIFLTGLLLGVGLSRSKILRGR